MTHFHYPGCRQLARVIATKQTGDAPGRAARDGATVRGFSAVSLLIVDEPARVTEDLYLAVRPMTIVGKGHQLAVGCASSFYGRMPFGRRMPSCPTENHHSLRRFSNISLT